MSARPVPPIARRLPRKSTVHGRVRVDDYGWLRDKESREVLSHLKAENAYTAAMMKPSQPLQKALYAEMLGRIKETDVDVPYREGGYFYYSRTQKGRQYRIFCRKAGSLEAQESVILDVNQAAKGLK